VKDKNSEKLQTDIYYVIHRWMQKVVNFKFDFTILKNKNENATG